MVTDQQYHELLNRVAALEDIVKALSRGMSEERMRAHSQIRQIENVSVRKRDIACYLFEGIT